MTPERTTRSVPHEATNLAGVDAQTSQSALLAIPTHYLIEARRKLVEPALGFVVRQANAHPGVPVVISVAAILLSPILYDSCNK